MSGGAAIPNSAPRRPSICGHRGAAGLAPENTLASFRKALELGADWIELDVHPTKDGRLVVIHDPILDRTTDGRGLVVSHALEEIKRLDAGRRFGPEFAGERIPTLQEVIELVAGRCPINIEIKNGPVFYPEIARMVVRELRQSGRHPGEFLVSSFDHRVLAELHEINPELPLGFLYGCIPVSYPQFLPESLPGALHPAWELVTPEQVEEAHRMGRLVNVWTVDDPQQALRLAAMGVDGIITNRPDRLLEAFSANPPAGK